MPGTGSLIDLQCKLQQVLAPDAVFRAPVWGDPHPMSEALRQVRRQFDSMEVGPSTANIKNAVLAFGRQGKASSFNQLKYVCYGVNLTIHDEGRRLIDSAGLFKRVLEAVEVQRDDARRFRRCYQALLQSYFAFGPSDGGGSASVAESNFETLRSYLSDNLAVIARPLGSRAAPAWVTTLKDHKNLLSDEPCQPYVAELRKGRTDHLAAVCEGLGINRESWVWQEVILAYLRETCNRTDTSFKDAMPGVLDLADGLLDLKPSVATSREIVVQLVKRYELAELHPEQPRLRDMAVELIGNPWLKRAQWDAWVGHEPARKMIDGWLKARLIRDFFELLAHDGAAEKRRLDYWLRFEPVIDDMWFVLGEDARQNRSPAFKELRGRMAGRECALSGATTSNNNAFVMRIGKLLLIEFGVTNNACFVFDSVSFRADLDKKWLSVNELKQAYGAIKLSHNGRWEQRFDSEICPRIGFWPSGRPTVSRSRESERATVVAPTPNLQPGSRLSDFLRLCASLGIATDDRRAKGGSLWVLLDVSPTAFLKDWLAELGFEHKPGRGYWLAD